MLPTLAISLIVLLLAAINAITGTGRRVLGHAGRTVRPQLGTVAACLGRCRCAISALLHATPSFLAVAGMRACRVATSFAPAVEAPETPLDPSMLCLLQLSNYQQGAAEYAGAWCGQRHLGVPCTWVQLGAESTHAGRGQRSWAHGPTPRLAASSRVPTSLGPPQTSARCGGTCTLNDTATSTTAFWTQFNREKRIPGAKPLSSAIVRWRGARTSRSVLPLR